MHSSLTGAQFSNKGMQKIALTGAAIVSLVTGCSLTDPEQKYKEEAAKGLKAYQTQHYSDSEQAYKAAADAAKQGGNSLQFPLMLRELSRAYLADGKYKQAEDALRQALAAYSELDKQENFKGNEGSVLKEREYETLSMLADCYMAEKNFTGARDTYFQAISLGSAIPEPPSNANQVNRNYIKALEQCGQHDLAQQMQRRANAAALTLDDFDDRIGQLMTMFQRGNYAAAQDEIETLEIASRGFIGRNPREARVLTFDALMKLIQNRPDQAQATVGNAIRITTSMNDSAADWSGQNTILALSQELQGDTATSISHYVRAFKMEPYHPNEIVEIVERGLKANGFPNQAAIAEARLKWLRTDPLFQIVPTDALQFVLQAGEEERNGQSDLAKQSRLNGLIHLEQGRNLTSVDEFRGAYKLYKYYHAQGNQPLANRALQQIRILGRRSHDTRILLDRVLVREGLKF